MKTTAREPQPGLREEAFRKICENGFGDGSNAYAYSMAWFKDRLIVGTSRANLMLLKFAMPFVKMDVWPVECPCENYSPEFETRYARGEIWSYNPAAHHWTRIRQAPMVRDAEGVEFSSELGYRAMCVFQGKSDPHPVLYVATWSRSRGNGPDILRTQDGSVYEVTPKPRFLTLGQNITFNAIRLLVPFKGRLFTAPTGATKGNVNAAGVSLIYESEDPAKGEWRCINAPGLGTVPDVVTVYEMAPHGDFLYAGTGGANGFQVWRSRCEGEPPYTWECILTNGAGRGVLNQGSVSMLSFKEALYVGTGIQNGGYDWRNDIGPAACELVRVWPNGEYHVIVGNERENKKPLSGFYAGFNNFFAGYLWRMGIHDEWLYAGTMDWSIILRYSRLEEKPLKAARLLAAAGVEDFIRFQGGFDLWRTADGDNWIPVTRTGFDNPYNFGCRNIVSTPVGLFIGTANPFGPRVATRKGKSWEWEYKDNPAGGLEVLLARGKRLDGDVRHT